MTPRNPQPDYWSNRKVLLTGHTGFKGGWLAIWLKRLGAHVTGVSLPPISGGLFEATRLKDHIDNHHEIDIRDASQLGDVVRDSGASVVFHLAAQPLVRFAYEHPVETFETNVVGTANLLEACRDLSTLETVLVATTDKVYRNDESGRSFIESDSLGGQEPYAASKVGTEQVVDAYRASYFASKGVRVLAARAGNVIGGGDISPDRLVCDAMQSFVDRTPLTIRNPAAVRPWQHVLEPVGGYLYFAELLGSDCVIGPSINLGPSIEDCLAVSEIVDRLCKLWGDDATWVHEPDGAIHESKLLRLDNSEMIDAGWKPRWDVEMAIEATVEWYRAQHAGEDMAATSLEQLHRFETTI